MAVRAKFRLSQWSASHISRLMRGVDKRGAGEVDPRNYEYVEVRTLTFVPVSDSTTYAENKLFWDATPSGKLEMAVVNPEAWQQFELGKEYYLDLALANFHPDPPRVDPVRMAALEAIAKKEWAEGDAVREGILDLVADLRRAYSPYYNNGT